MQLLIFLLKLIASSGILLGYYWLALRNRNFHRYNRFYLLAAVATSLVMPFISIDFLVPAQEPAGKLFLQTFDVITVNDAAAETENSTTAANGIFFSMNFWLATAYTAGTLFMGLLLFRSVRYIQRLRKTYPMQELQDIRFYQTTEPGTPFSFFRSIFWNNHIVVNSTEGQQIFRHELYHVKQQHSADLLFMELVLLLAWFNPFYYLIRKELKVIHEFLADKHAASGGDEYAYAELLVLFALQEKQQQLVHPFFHHTIKRRITMLTQLKNRKMGYWGRIMALPLSFLLFSFIVIKAQEMPTAETISTLDNTENKSESGKENQQEQNRTEQDSLPLQKDKPYVITVTRPAKKTPGTKEWAAWKDGKTYGVWLNDKRISNETLNQYKPEQIAWYNVSKLSKNAVNYGKHYYQVNLVTAPYYKQIFPKEKYQVQLQPANVKNKNVALLPDSLKRYIQRHLNRNLHYPDAALQKNLTSTHYFSMEADANGNLSGLKFYDHEIKDQPLLGCVVVSLTRNAKPSIGPALGEMKQLFIDEITRTMRKYQPPAGWNDSRGVGRIYFKIEYFLEPDDAQKTVVQEPE